MCAPLNKITPTEMKFKWTQLEQYDLNEIKRTVVRDNLLTYMYFIKTFEIHTNTSAFQLGAVITQKVKVIAFYSRKLTVDKKVYSNREGTNNNHLNIKEI